MKSYALSRLRTAIRAVINRAPAARGNQIGFQKITRRFWSDPSRKASHEARRDAFETNFEGPFWTCFGQPAAAARRSAQARIAARWG